ncbi:hypothetical protein TNCV_1259201 [Trichonephila clavipes]|nr:hypothetical protein TNCV_1259201 [Trichonephila clavipes]
MKQNRGLFEVSVGRSSVVSTSSRTALRKMRNLGFHDRALPGMRRVDCNGDHHWTAEMRKHVLWSGVNLVL